MGLYDGAGASEFASTAHVARLLDAPVVLVVDAAKQSRSVAALVHGFASYDTRIRLGGVILNRVGSDRHESICREALAESGVPVLGAIRRSDAVATPSRHLGLVPAAERRTEAARPTGRAVARRPVVADRAATSDARSSRPGRGDQAPAAATPSAVGPGRRGSPPVPGQAVRIAVAGGQAFTFGYAEHAELLTAAGAEVVPFDPLRDEALPEGTARLVIGGGFPEVYAAELSANEPLRERGRRVRRADLGRVRGPALPRPASWTAGRCAGSSTSRPG